MEDLLVHVQHDGVFFKERLYEFFTCDFSFYFLFFCSICMKQK